MKIAVILAFIWIFGLAFSDEINGDDGNSTDFEEVNKVDSEVNDPTHKLCRSNNFLSKCILFCIDENSFNH